jgi:hypothetical protein
MKGSRFGFSACCLAAVLLAGCGSSEQSAAEAPAGEGQGAAPAAEHAEGHTANEVELPGWPERPFLRVNLDKAQWRPAENNTLGVMTTVIEGDPSKPGFYITVNKFPPGVMSRPHYHPDERNGLVIKGTWYTGEGDTVEPSKAVGLKPGDYMRHPKGGHHYDGALDEEVIVAIMGHGPTGATVIDGGELFGKVR